MTAATDTATSAPAGAGGALTGTGTLLRFLLRRDRIRLPLWLIGIGVFVPYFFTAFHRLFPTEEDLAQVADFTSGPMLGLLGGPGYGLDPGQLTYFTFFGAVYVLYFMVAAAIMNILLISRHTRVEEQTGRAELIRANVVGRHAALTATTIVAAASNLLLAILLLAGLRVFEAPLAGAAAVAAGIGVFGLLFAGISIVAAQVSENSRVGSAIAGGILGGAFVLRAAGDMTGEHGSALSWITPFAWSQQTRAFVDERWWPLLLSLVVAAGLITAGFMLSTRRDLGAGLRASRPGRSGAPAWLGSPLTLAWRLHRGSVRGWAIGLVIGGLVYGTTAEPLVDSFTGLMDTRLSQVLSSGAGDLLAGYLNMMVVMMVIAAAIFLVLAVQKVRGEEAEGRAEPVLATCVNKGTWLFAHVLVTAVAAVVLLVLACAAMGLTAAFGTGDWSLLADLSLAALAYSPALLVVLAVATALYGLHPRLLPITAALVAFGGLAAFFGDMLELPEPLLAISPWQHTPAYPVETVTALPLILQTVVFAALTGLGIRTFARRDLASV